MTPDLISRYVADPLELSEEEREALLALIETDAEECRRMRELLVLDEALSARMTAHRAHFPNRMRKRMAMQESGRLFAARLSAAAKNLPDPGARTAGRRWWWMGAPLAAAALLVIGWWLGAATGTSTAIGVVATPGAVVQRGGAPTTITTAWPLAIGDSVTAPNGSVTLHYSDGTELVLASGASLTISALSESAREVVLDTGTLSAEVAHLRPGAGLCVRTAQAEARVIGTRFIVHADDGRTRLEVESGRVAFTDRAVARTVSVGPGERAEAGALETSAWLIDACDSTEAWQSGSTPVGGAMAMTIDPAGHRGGCLACTFTSGRSAYPWAMRVIGPGHDCRADTGVRFWLRGAGDGRRFCLMILDYDPMPGDALASPIDAATRFSAAFIDDHVGWRQVEIPFTSLSPHDPAAAAAGKRLSLASVVGVVLFPLAGDGVVAFDELEVYRR